MGRPQAAPRSGCLDLYTLEPVGHPHTEEIRARGRDTVTVMERLHTFRRHREAIPPEGDLL